MASGLSGMNLQRAMLIPCNAHPDIAIQFAQWCSPKFALWVSRQIRHLLEHGEVNLNHTEWTTQQHIIGIEYNRDDIKEMYG